jgi:hypothetical protein
MFARSVERFQGGSAMLLDGAFSIPCTVSIQL